MGTFDGLATSLSSLYAQRRGLDVTGQNIANANTPGYTRQRVDLQSTGAPRVPAIFSTWNGGGGGVTVAQVTRMRDTFLEMRGRTEHANLASATVRSAALTQVENLVDEPSDTGLRAALGDFWAGFGDIANNPGDTAARSQLLEQAESVAGWLRGAAAALDAQWTAARTDLTNLASEANTAAAGIADLNGAIKQATLAGLPSNELQDQRDQMVMKLAELTGATARSGEDGVVNVYLGGTALVTGTHAERLAVSAPNQLSDVTPTAQAALVWAGDSAPVSAAGGKAGGLLEVLNTDLPSYLARFNGVAGALAATVNGQQAAGYDLDGNAGGPLFTGATAATIAVATTNPRAVAAAKTPGTLDGSNADAMAALATSPTGPDELYRQLVTGLGVDAQSATRRVDVQTAVTSNVDDARDSEAGVNIDEEMVNMLTYQRAYEGASRMLTAVDEMLDQLINKTGLVGR